MRPVIHKLAILVIIALGAIGLPSKLQAQTLQIDSFTADWIEGFADFTRWPNESQSHNITIALIDAPEVANYLKRRAAERTSKPKLRIVNLSANDSFEYVDILFVGAGNRANWKTIFEKCQGEGILSIGSQEGFCQSGGCVELVVRKNRLRFLINTDNANQSDVTLSSKLLELAVHP
ncbi:YfiR family protein [Pelagicoccus mobilis]|uniref:YfiR family protein n=1 Tax=Pelagicoccus mobilis TaxID=415221 RepID=A0A934VPY4_9BACT|nr:YfiR family protein [Pelagicoccus mobilis]MBK1876008.1 YfiR family protein [Pelagicoccus mobilis]